MKRIAFIAHLSEVSGAGVALVEAASGLSAWFESWLVLPGAGPLEQLALERNLRYVIIHNPQRGLDESGFGDKLRIGAGRAGYVRQLRKFLRQNRINLAYVNSSASVFPGFAARVARVPVAWHIHETLNVASKPGRLRKGVISRLADGLIYASNSGMQSFPPPLGTPAIVARNYVPISVLSKIADSRRYEMHERPRILLNGTYRLKGADVLLSAVTALMEDAPGVIPVVEIAGPAVASESFYFDLLRRAEDPPLKGQVEFTGLQRGLSAALARADVFVSASRSEAMPIAVVEAMAAGVPVVATDVGDCAELLDHGKCGWVVPPESPHALAAALEEVLREPQLAATKARYARDKVSVLYHEENFWEPLHIFLNGLLSRHGK